jgi:hypothetical protein
MGGLTIINKNIMAVSIDTVYQRVLGILNKEQRGYITPQEFNLMANQAQLDIFEQYFYDLNQFTRVGRISNEYADIISNIEEKISLFETSNTPTAANDIFPIPSDLYRMGSILYGNVEAEEVSKKEYSYIISSPIAKPTNDFPIYKRNVDGVSVFGTGTINTNVTFNYIKKPIEVQWAYTSVGGEALYNATNSQNFELHGSEETELVIKILAMAGLIIKDPSIYQAASSEENKKIQLEKS